MKSLNRNYTDDELSIMIKDFDPLDTKILKFWDFLVLISKYWKDPIDQKLYDLFKEMDCDNDGLITADDFQKYMKCIPVEISYEDVEEVIREFDSDGDGCINFAEYCKMYKSIDLHSSLLEWYLFS